MRAAIAFTPEGAILSANQVFLDRDSRDDDAFWARLRAGRRETATFKRVTRAGDAIWLKGSCHPIRDRAGMVTGVMTYAIDVAPETLAVAARWRRREASGPRGAVGEAGTRPGRE